MRGKFVGSVTVGERGQIVVPAEARKEFGIDFGDKLLVFSRHNGLFLMKADDVMEYVERKLADLSEMRAVVVTNTNEAADDETERAQPGGDGKDDVKQGGRRGKRGGGNA